MQFHSNRITCLEIDTVERIRYILYVCENSIIYPAAMFRFQTDLMEQGHNFLYNCIVLRSLEFLILILLKCIMPKNLPWELMSPFHKRLDADLSYHCTCVTKTQTRESQSCLNCLVSSILD